MTIAQKNNLDNGRLIIIIKGLIQKGEVPFTSMFTLNFIHMAVCVILINHIHMRHALAIHQTMHLFMADGQHSYESSCDTSNDIHMSALAYSLR
jgi:hypothetical protein